MKCTDEKNISLAVKGYKIFFSSTSLTSNGKPTSGLKINRKPVVGFNHKKRQLISGRGSVQKAQISRLESNASNVTIDTLMKVFTAFKAKVKLQVELPNAKFNVAR